MPAFKYRPICDLWFLTRAKLQGGVKFYGAYVGGFPERARALLGCNLNDPVLHVCGGMAKLYPYRRGFGPNDKTLDLDPATEPDFLQDAREPFPLMDGLYGWPGILIDPPYSPEDAQHYAPGPDKYPKPVLLVRNAWPALVSGGRVGIIHYQVPAPPKDAVFVAAVGVLSGYNNRCRVYSVFERP